MSTEARGRAKGAFTGSGGRWWASIVLATVGLAAAVYLTWLKYAGAFGSCIGVGNCELVNQSSYSELWGVPIALFGAFSYALLMALLVSERRSRADWPLLATFGVSTFGAIYSAYLTYVELAILEAICPYCVISAVAMAGLWLVTIDRLRGSEFPAGG